MVIMPIINLTQHPIIIISNYEYSPTIRKNIVPDGVEPEIKKVIPSFAMASGKFKTIILDDFEDCPRGLKIAVGCDGLPKVEDPDNTIFIVSTAYAKAYRRMHPKADMSNIYLKGETVYNADGNKLLGTVRILQYDEI